MNTQTLIAGAALVCVGLAVKNMQEILDQQQELLRAVAADNMALRFYIHEKEVQKNA